MFENVLGQGAAGQLIDDINANTLSRAMLFSGPPASGKGTAALELGRVTSCEAETIGLGNLPGKAREVAEWNCACPACSRHRLLIHPDLLCIGRKNFSAEIAASAGAFLREAALRGEAPPTKLATPTPLAASPGKTDSSPCRLLFIRSVRKLLLRFSPVLWEDDPKAGKISPLVNSLEEGLDELSSFTDTDKVGDAKGTPGKFVVDKIVESIQKDAAKLQSEGMSETIPIAQLRRAAFWCRLAPSGREKLLVIENADRMQEEGRNSLLKLLEEPSARLRIVLTSARPGSLSPTILSRLRPYRFNSRGAAVEAEVIKRVFRDKAALMETASIEAGSSGTTSTEAASIRLAPYLDSFLPVSASDLEALSSYFAASVAYKAALLSKRDGRPLPEELVLLGKYSAPKAEAAGLGRPKEDSGPVIATILEKADKFEVRSLFSRFLYSLLEQVSQSQRAAATPKPANQAPLPVDNPSPPKDPATGFLPSIACHELWARCCNLAESAVGTYNLRPAQVLEKLFTDLSRGMAGL